jgi:3-hydroxybutyryl-CoA dehydrogenase
MAIKKVGILGCGLMGSGIAQVTADFGYQTLVREVDQKFLDKGLKGIEKNMAKAVERGKMFPEALDRALARLKGTTNLEDLKDCDLVIEAITEDLNLKNEQYKVLDKICPPHTIFSSNTSSLKVSDMAASTKRPDKFVGLHFFNPVPVMKLVEVVRTPKTSDQTFNTVFEFCKSLSKVPIAANDNSGFIVNLLLVPYILDAIRALEKGVGSVEDIDAGMKLGCNMPMGPLTLLDFVGLDTTYFIAQIMEKEYGEANKYGSPKLLAKMVEAGYNGRKSGKGFYDYADPNAPRASNLSAFMK